MEGMGDGETGLTRRIREGENNKRINDHLCVKTIIE